MPRRVNNLGNRPDQRNHNSGGACINNGVHWGRENGNGNSPGFALKRTCGEQDGMTCSVLGFFLRKLSIVAMDQWEQALDFSQGLGSSLSCMRRAGALYHVCSPCYPYTPSRLLHSQDQMIVVELDLAERAGPAIDLVSSRLHFFAHALIVQTSADLLPKWAWGKSVES